MLLTDNRNLRADEQRMRKGSEGLEPKTKAAILSAHPVSNENIFPLRDHT